MRIFSDHETSVGESLDDREGPGGPERFGVQVRSEREGVVVMPVGELDLATAEPLERVIRAVQGAGTPPPILDLRGLSFMDCSGLGVLLRAQARADTTHGRFTVACGAGQVRRLLMLTGADRRLEIFEHLTSLGRSDGVRA